jgi:hypothetical protein
MSNLESIMRTTIFLLAAAAVLAACSEETTAPLANKSAFAADNTPTAEGVGVPQAARTRLTITEVATPYSDFAGAGNVGNILISGHLKATCPLGMSAIAGGHDVAGNAGDIVVYESRLFDQNTWQISVINVGPAYSLAHVKATVMCVQ